LNVFTKRLLQFLLTNLIPRSLVGEGDNGDKRSGYEITFKLDLNQLGHYAVVDPGSLNTRTRPAIIAPIRHRNYLEWKTAKMVLFKKKEF